MNYRLRLVQTLITLCGPQFPRPLEPCYQIIDLLSDVFQSVVFPTHPTFKTAEYHDRLTDLEQKILAAPTGLPDGSVPSSSTSPSPPSMNTLAEMYKLTALIYLERYARNDMDDTSKIRVLANKAFQLLNTISSCDQPFILFIFGCEAYSDARRLRILDLIEELRDTDRALELMRVRAMLNFIWGQEDLGTKWESNIFKLEKAFGVCNSVPSFT